MNTEPDVLVIGGGVVGLFCAYFLRRDGAAVAVAERGSIGGPQSCSSGNTGFVGTQGSVPLAEPGVPAQGLRWLLDPYSPFYVRPRWDPELLCWLWRFRRACTEEAAKAGFRVLLDLKKRSLEILRELCASDGLAPTYKAPGMLLVCRTAEAFEKARRSVPALVESGVPMRVLEREELRELEPDAGFDVCGAVLNEEGAYLDAGAFMAALGRLLAYHGVAVHEHTEVTGLDVADGRVTRVRTTAGELRPAQVVLAAGAWSATLARGLGVRLPLQPAKGYTITVPTPRGAPRLPAVLSEGKVAMAPLDGRLRFGGTLELSGMDGGISRRRVAGILRTVRSYLPELEIGNELEVWSGLRSCAPDGIPLVGHADPYRNLFVACGHSHIGMGLAPATGLLIARLLAGDRPEINPGPLHVGRFDGRPAREGKRP